MAKFCTKCGKKLEEGEVCSCTKKASSKAKEKKVVVEENTAIDIKSSCMDCLNVFKNIFTKPFEAINEFVCESKWISGIIMIVLAAISSGIYKIATLKNMYSASSANGFSAGELSSLFESALSGKVNAEPEYLKEFLTTFANSFIEYALIVLLGYIIISKLLKGTATWKQMITAVAISVSVVLVGYLINSVLVFIDGDFMGNIRSYVSSFAYISSLLILFTSVKDIAEVDKNKLFVSIASMSVFATAIIDIAKKIFN